MTLYAIDAEIAEILANAIDEKTGEMVDCSERLEALAIAREEKIKSFGLWVKNTRAAIKMIRDEELSLADKRHVLEKQIENNMNGYIGQSIRRDYPDGFVSDDHTVEIGYTKSKSLYVEDELAFLSAEQNAEYIRVKKELDKTKITNAIKNGETIEGCSLVVNSNIKIK